MKTLKKTLFEEFGGFADRRIKIKDLDSFDTFFVDGRTVDDIGSDRKPFGWFCIMTLTVITPDQVELVLSGNIPMSSKIEQWIAANHLSIDKCGRLLPLTVTQNNVNLLDSLATLIADITRVGAPRYSDASFKYACPKASSALNRLSRVLKKEWGC